MIDLGIEQGDLILVKRKSEATDGQIVVALTEEGNTLKRIRYEDGKPVLYAEIILIQTAKESFIPNNYPFRALP